ncbi:MAG: 3-deoxy-manno-octulosonate cytidylyltransferase, partial [Flavobacteriales bacterium]
MKKILAIIPARYSSTRLPGKPLAEIGGKPMIELVYRRVKSCSAISQVLVATDDLRIAEAVQEFGGDVMLTSDTCISGTDRCAEALQQLQGSWDLVLNVQGDEPFIHPEQLQQLIDCMQLSDADAGTLIKKITVEEDLHNPNVVKAVITSQGKALYFSRQPIPFVRQTGQLSWTKQTGFYRHLGIYAFRAEMLPVLAALPPGMLEQAESLEQL